MICDRDTGVAVDGSGGQRGIAPQAGQFRLGMDSRGRYRENGGMQQSLSARLAGIVLQESEGRAVRLGSLWENGPAVIAFLRHYG